MSGDPRQVIAHRRHRYCDRRVDLGSRCCEHDPVGTRDVDRVEQRRTPPVEGVGATERSRRAVPTVRT